MTAELPMIFDLHQDISDSVLYTTNTDFLGENKLHDGQNEWGIPVNNQTDYHRLKKVGVRGVVATSYIVGFDTKIKKPDLHTDFEAELWRHLDLYHRIINRSQGNIILIENRGDLLGWKDGSLMGFLLSVEGLNHMDKDLLFLDRLYRGGVRAVALTYNGENMMGGGCEAGSVGLTELGKRVIRRMGELGMILDLTRMGEKSFDEALKMATGPVWVSYTACRDLLDHPRNLTTEQMRMVAEKGGLIGICGVPAFVGPDLANVVEHFMMAIDAAGADHVALGSGFGGISSKKLINDFEDVTDIYKLARGLNEAGLGERGLAMVFSGNVIRFLEENLK